MGIEKKAKSVGSALVAVALLGACSPTSSGVKTGSDAKTSVSAKPSSKTNAPAKVGSAITLNGNGGGKVTVTLVKIVDPVKSTDGFSTPTAGNRYVAAQFIIQNVGTTAYDDSPSNGAKAIDAAGQQFSTDITLDKSTAGPGLPAQTKIPSGGKALGFLVFQVPTASKVAKVQFSQNSGFGETGEWTVA